MLSADILLIYLLVKSMPDCHDVAWGMQRLGKYSLDQKRPRPIRMIIDSVT